MNNTASKHNEKKGGCGVAADKIRPGLTALNLQVPFEIAGTIELHAGTAPKATLIDQVLQPVLQLRLGLHLLAR